MIDGPGADARTRRQGPTEITTLPADLETQARVNQIFLESGLGKRMVDMINTIGFTSPSWTSLPIRIEDCRFGAYKYEFKESGTSGALAVIDLPNPDPNKRKEKPRIQVLGLDDAILIRIGQTPLNEEERKSLNEAAQLQEAARNKARTRQN